MKRRYTFALFLLLIFAVRIQAHGAQRGKTVDALNQDTRELFSDSMVLGDQCWDESAKMLVFPMASLRGEGHGMPELAGKYLMVRESSWYALGLLFRDGPGDRQRAAEALDAVLKQQFTNPADRWYGTFRRRPDEPTPGPHAVMWRDYDPNWRHFIGTTFAMILIEFSDRIPAELAKRMYASIDLSIEGEIREGRLQASYTNIALIYGFLWDFAAAHDKRADWQKQSSEWAETVYRLYKAHNAFNEYNSPTYSGTDLYGLALWRRYGSTARMRQIGSEMEAGLWADLISLYQPELRNISGPYDRSYGMDMESYVSVTGMWMRTLLDAEHAPLPKIAADTDHVADIWMTPHIAILGTEVAPKTLAAMKHFEGEHLVQRNITDERAASAWIGSKVIFGGEATSKTKDAGEGTQFHPATVQWRTPSGQIGWVRLLRAPMIDVTADRQGLTVATIGTVRWRIYAKDLDKARISATSWDLPGLSIGVKSDVRNFKLESAGENTVDLVYDGVSGMRLAIPSGTKGAR